MISYRFIKPKLPVIVKSLACTLTLILSVPCWAETSPQPTLKVRRYKVRVEKRSETQRVYLFKITSGTGSKKNAIILLRPLDSQENVMAFRVIKNYKDQLFAGSRVRSYENYPILEPDEDYLAIEKIGELYPQTEEERLQDESDLKEIESGLKLEVLEYDPELDAGTSPLTETIEENDESLAIDETPRFDVLKNWLTFQLSLVRNYSSDGGGKYYSGFGFRYGRTIGQYLFFNDKNIQDTLVAEGGFFFYSVSPFTDGGTDRYGLLSFIATLRYHLFLSQKFAPYFYLGLMKNFIHSQENSTSDGIAQLSSILPSVGVGFIHQLGPKWDIRVELGLDTIGAGLILRF